MAGYISEFFGYRSEDRSDTALRAAARRLCPFTNAPCQKILARQGIPSGVCSIRQKTPGSPVVICCPIRMYAGNYAMLHMVAEKAFKTRLNLYAGRVAVDKAKVEKGSVAVFGHGWGGELRLPQRKGTGAYFVDWVLARLDGKGQLAEFTAIEVQTIDTTGNYQKTRAALLNDRFIIADTVGLNWENVNKRIIPQLIYKGQVLQREELCMAGLFFVSPLPVHTRVIERLGGKDKIPSFPYQPASIHFLAYDRINPHESVDGKSAELGFIEEHCTTVYKVQEAFSAVTLPEGNVYRDAILRSLYPKMKQE